MRETNIPSKNKPIYNLSQIFRSTCLIISLLAICYIFYSLGKISVYNEQIEKLNIQTQKNIDQVKELNDQANKLISESNDLHNELMKAQVSEEPLPQPTK